MRKALACAVVFLCGCGSSSSDPQCALRQGTYTIDWIPRSGSCGPIAEQIEMFDQTSTKAVAPTSPCGGNEQISGDNCKVTLDVTCPNADGTELVEEKGTETFSVDGASGSGIVEYVLNNANGIVCTETYDVQLTRQ